MILETIEILDNNFTMTLEQLETKIANGDYDDLLDKYNLLMVISNGLILINKADKSCKVIAPADLKGYINNSIVDLNEIVNNNSLAINTIENTMKSKTIIVTLTDTELIVTLNHNTEIRCGEVTTMSINMPTSISDDYISSVIFTSGATATVFDYPDTIKMIGEGCVDGRFIPGINKRYEIIISYDGVNFVGAVGGYAI